MRLLCTLLLLVISPLAAHAALLGTVSLKFDFSVSPPAAHQVIPGMTYDQTAILFDDVVLTASSAGQVLTATSADPDFYPVVAKMADGVSDVLYFRAVMTNSTAFSWDEGKWFSLSTNDFAGSNITSITLTVNEISFSTVDPWTTLHLAYTVRVYGEAPLAVQSTTWGAVKALYR